MTAPLASPRMLYGFVVPLASPLPTPNSRLHWRSRARMIATIRRETYLAVCSEMTRLGIPCAEEGEHRTLTLTLLRGKGQRMLDVDNCIASIKPALDGMGRPGRGGPGALLIADDDAAHCTVTYRQERAKNGWPGLMVEVLA